MPLRLSLCPASIVTLTLPFFICHPSECPCTLTMHWLLSAPRVIHNLTAHSHRLPSSHATPSIFFEA